MGCASSLPDVEEECGEFCGTQMCGEEESLTTSVHGSILAGLSGLKSLMRTRSSANFFTEGKSSSFFQYYSIGEIYDVDYSNVLGTGLSGMVVLGIHRKSKVKYAVKVLNKKKLKPEKLLQLQQEIQIMASLDHPNILRLQEIFESNEDIHLVLELLHGGELLDRLHAQEHSMFSERVTRRYVHTILTAVRYCHEQGIVHRDLKLENFLFESKNLMSELKLIDFGLSQRVSGDEVLTKACGTPYYVSPEVLGGSYTSKCDIWSLGVITYMLLTGSPPFHGRTDKDILKSVKSGFYKLGDKNFANVSASCKSFIKACLVKGEDRRQCADELMQHPWFKLELPDDEINDGKATRRRSNSLPPAIQSPASKQEIHSLISRMEKFGKHSSLGKLFLDVVARTLTPEQIVSKREEFNRIDKKRRGVFELQDLKDALGRGLDETSDDASVSLDRSTSTAATPPPPPPSVCPPSPIFSELESIFNAADFDHSGTMYFHEFLASTLTDIDDVNLQLAFDKISMQTETITSEAIAVMLGKDDTSPADVEELLREAGLGPKVSEFDFETFKKIVNQDIAPSAKSPMASRWRKRFAFE